MLNYKKETAAAVAEAEALEAVVDKNSERHSSMLNLDSSPLEAAQRTEQYVIDQAESQNTDAQLHDDGVGAIRGSSPNYETPASSIKSEVNSFHPAQANIASHHTHGHNAASQPTRLISQQPYIYEDEKLDGTRNVRFDNHNATPEQGLGPQNDKGDPALKSYLTSSNTNNNNSNISDFVRYFARRELVATGLLQFNDRPQNYRAWKRSFQNATRGLDLTPSEEMDLLFKWLGKASAEQVEHIRAIHINHPAAGLAMIWDRLEQSYGSAEVIEDALFKRIDAFPKITNRDYSKLTKLSDLLMELESAKAEGDLPGLSFLDTTRGVNPIVQKLPFGLQEKWASVGSSYKRQHHVSYPPFACFVNFVSQEASVKNDPSFNFVSHSDISPRPEKTAWKPNRPREVSVHKTEIFPKAISDPREPSTKFNDCDKLCPIHKKPHPIRKCRAFREMPIEDRKTFLKENNVCFRCCASSSHIARYCTFNVRCYECKSEKHHTALHPGPAPWVGGKDSAPEHGGEEDSSPQPHVTTKCTDVCGGDVTDRSCSKISLVNVYPAGHAHKAVKMYVILDEQSNRSLLRSQFFEVFNDQSPSAPYSLKTCAGVKKATGRRACGYIVESLDRTVSIPLPSLIECDDIPNNRSEIPTLNAAFHHAHLKSVAHLIPDIDPQAPIMLLLGRDIIRVHKVRKQVNGPHNLPYAQKLDLGWIIVGNVCLGRVHKPSTVNAFYTNTTERGRPTLFDPCPNMFRVKEKYSDTQATNHLQTHPEEISNCDVDSLGHNIFKQTKDDNNMAPSIQDISFMKIMKGLTKDANNSWVAPLPFKCSRQRLPNNRPQALNRLKSLRRNFERKPEMRDHFLSFMDKMFKNGHAELAPSSQ
ncbi:uncharacterized protein LOC117729138 isoform X1 [Cyclopterus lumpus]|uniref:uncharacterized protein LOC117729138 isoform X1 n=1 Tax=Cyclopterus lumpus TaxID=8103 RepID=UPI0014867A3E|nr:uncharacterized protein LOC117729138 isoform X1 [Cyclopterus lumpus]